jgi:putative phosphoribosyl transferase
VKTNMTTHDTTEVRVPAGPVTLIGDLGLPADAAGLVLFAHGSGSGRRSPRNRFVAERLREAGLGTLLLDLLTADEEAVDARTGHLRFDISLLARRLVLTMDWLGRQRQTAALPVGLFGASTGAAAALVAAAIRPGRVAGIVSRGGRPDLAGDALAVVTAPTLLIVGGADGAVVGMNEEALAQLRCARDLRVVPGAGHLFEEPGALAEVASLAAGWLARCLGAARREDEARGDRRTDDGDRHEHSLR